MLTFKYYPALSAIHRIALCGSKPFDPGGSICTTRRTFVADCSYQHLPGDCLDSLTHCHCHLHNFSNPGKGEFSFPADTSRFTDRLEEQFSIVFHGQPGRGVITS